MMLFFTKVLNFEFIWQVINKVSGVGVSCVTCHGRIDQMEKVYQAKQLSMAWCISCHREPNEHLRPVNRVTKLDWEWDPNELDVDGNPLGDQAAWAKKHIGESNINPLVNCAVCHR